MSIISFPPATKVSEEAPDALSEDNIIVTRWAPPLGQCSLSSHPPTSPGWYLIALSCIPIQLLHTPYWYERLCCNDVVSTIPILSLFLIFSLFGQALTKLNLTGAKCSLNLNFSRTHPLAHPPRKVVKLHTIQSNTKELLPESKFSEEPRNQVPRKIFRKSRKIWHFTNEMLHFG